VSPGTVVPKKHKIVPALMDRAISHMLTVFASFCTLISVEYILINKTNVCVFLVICLRNDTACHWVVSRPLPFGLMHILKKNSIKN
jgi:hypothetical protein